MTKFNYNPVLSNTTLKTKEEQDNLFFYSGHPLFLIPDFNQYPSDIWLSYMEFLERNHSCQIYDQDGGEITLHQIIDNSTGLTKCIYTAYGIMLDESDDPQDVNVEVEGYIVMDNNVNDYVFVATQVFEEYKFSI